MQAVIDAAREGVKHEILASVGSIRTVLIHGHGALASRVEKIDLENGADYPLRARGNTSVFDAESFNAIIAINTDGHIIVYVDRNPLKPAVIGVLNSNGIDGLGWGDHRVSIAFRHTPQWQKWMGIDGKMLSQSEFANFIEDNLLDVVDPPAADMLEISQFLEVTRTTNFKSVTRPKTGLIQFRNESTDGIVGDMQVPDTITLMLAPLFGIPAQAVSARFRYRIEGDKLKLGVKLQRIEELMEQIMANVVDAIVLPEGAIMVEGVAPAA